MTHQTRHFLRTARDVAGCPYMLIVLATAGVLWIIGRVRA